MKTPLTITLQSHDHRLLDISVGRVLDSLPKDQYEDVHVVIEPSSKGFQDNNSVTIQKRSVRVTGATDKVIESFARTDIPELVTINVR
jgi:ribosomal protein S10